MFPCSPSRGGEDSECGNPTGEGKDSVCTVPTGGGKDSVCTAPTGEGKESVCTVPSRGGENSVCTGYIQPSSVKSVHIQEKLQNLPVGGRLRQFLPEWEKLGSHQLIIGLIRDGYKLPFRERPNLSRVPCIVSSYAGFDKQNALWTSIQDLLQKGAVKVVHNPDSLGFYSRLFLVPKPGNRWRPVIDLSALNKFLGIPKFKMETPESIRTSLRKGEWVTSIDLTDACLHVPIHTQSQKYLRFHFQGVTYQFTSLPFGLATAPLIFTSIVKEVKLIAKTKMHGTDSKITKAGEGFGLYSQPQEVRPHTSQRFDFLGYHFLLDLALVKPTQDRWTKLQEMFHHLSMKSVISARTLMSTIGLLASTEKTVKLGRMHMRPFQWHLKTHWKYPMPLDTPIPWNQKMIRHGEWWLDPQNVLQGEFLHSREHEKLIFTDASNAGWGAHLGQNSTGGVSSVTEKHLHINLLELKAVLLALRFFQTDCRNNQVLIASDNTSVVAYINKQGGTRSAELCALMWRILTWCHQNNVTLRARHVPGSLNVIVDGLSRRNQIQPTEWSLSPQIFKQISKLWKSPQVDLFATSLNKKLPTYVSPIPDPQAWAVDALNIQWENLVAYAFPPTALLPKVVQKLQSQTCRMILIAPGWPTKPWWDLVELSLDIPRQLPPIHTAPTTTEQPLPCQPNIAELPRLVSQSSALQEHGFSAEVAERIAAPQRLSTRSIYASKWTVFQCWCTDTDISTELMLGYSPALNYQACKLFSD